MKFKLILFAAALSFGMACNSENKSGDSGTTTMPAVGEETAKTDNTAKIKAGKFDPVCEMDYDTGWVEMTVYNGDTIRFCSDNCKTAFVAHPEKYLK